MARDAYALLEQETIIFWSRKAGNTSLAVWLADVVLPERKRRLIGKLHPRKFFAAAQYRVDAPLAARLVRDMGFTSYILCRNPYARLVSAYVNKFVYDGSDTLETFRSLEPFSRKLVVEMRQAADPGLTSTDVARDYAGLTFREFATFVCDRIEERGRREPDLNGHWNTQVPFSFADFDYDHVIHLEKLRSELLGLANRLGASPEFPRLRTTAVGVFRQRTRERLADVPSLELLSRNLEVAAPNLLEPAIADRIARCHALDFAKLGYDPAAVPTF